MVGPQNTFSPQPLTNTFSHLSSVAQSCPNLCDPMASLSITNSCSLLRLMSIELVMPSNHLILCCPLLLPSSIFSSIRVSSNKSVFHTNTLLRAYLQQFLLSGISHPAINKNYMANHKAENSPFEETD